MLPQCLHRSSTRNLRRDGSLEVFRAEGPSEGWQTINARQRRFYPRKWQARAPKYFSHPNNLNHREQAATLQLLP